MTDEHTIRARELTAQKAEALGYHTQAANFRDGCYDDTNALRAFADHLLATAGHVPPVTMTEEEARRRLMDALPGWMIAHDGMIHGMRALGFIAAPTDPLAKLKAAHPAVDPATVEAIVADFQRMGVGHG